MQKTGIVVLKWKSSKINYEFRMMCESIFERIKNLSNWLEKYSSCQTNKFSLRFIWTLRWSSRWMDSWRSHWRAKSCSSSFSTNFRKEKNVWITYFSGDVYWCGIRRIQSRGPYRPLTINYAKLIYQIISSDIVNISRSEIDIRIAHLFRTKWNPIDNTEEVIDFFERN
jgi:hypothetical protein